MSDYHLNERLMQLRVEEEHRQAALRRLQPQVRADRASWPARRRYQALSWLGCFLISSGQRLLQYVSPLPPSAGTAGRGA